VCCAMKTKLILTVAAAFALACVARAADHTAFSLVKDGDRFVGEQSKDKVVQIRSERSAGTLTPDIWYIVYYDADAPLKAVQVKFGAGQKMDVSRPLRLLEPINGNDRVLDPLRLKVDSNQALDIAKSQPLLQHVVLTSSQLWLQHGDEGPQWKVKLWAARNKNSDRQRDVGDVYIGAAGGTVIRADLHPERVE
jgi:hypothetical protein